MSIIVDKPLRVRPRSHYEENFEYAKITGHFGLICACGKLEQGNHMVIT